MRIIRPIKKLIPNISDELASSSDGLNQRDEGGIEEGLCSVTIRNL